MPGAAVAMSYVGLATATEGSYDLGTLASVKKATHIACIFTVSPHGAQCFFLNHHHRGSLNLRSTAGLHDSM